MLLFPLSQCHLPHNSPYWILGKGKTPRSSWEIAYTTEHPSAFTPLKSGSCPKAWKLCFLRHTTSIYLKFHDLFLIPRKVFQTAISFINCLFYFTSVKEIDKWLNRNSFSSPQNMHYLICFKCIIFCSIFIDKAPLTFPFVLQKAVFYTPILTTFGNDKASYTLFTICSQPRFSWRNTESTIHDFLLVFWERVFQALLNLGRTSSLNYLQRNRNLSSHSIQN